jgi:hypothetical protein
MVAQADGRFSVDDPPPITNTFLVRKIRPTFTGRITRFFEFKLMPDFGSRRQLYKTRMWMRDSRPRSAFGAQGQDASGSMGRRSGPRSLFETRRRRRNFFARAGDGRGEPRHAVVHDRDQLVPERFHQVLLWYARAPHSTAAQRPRGPRRTSFSSGRSSDSEPLPPVAALRRFNVRATDVKPEIAMLVA